MSLRLTDFEEIHSSIFSKMLGMFAVSKQVDQNFSSVFVAFVYGRNLNWNTLSVLSLVQRNQYSFIVFKPFYLIL